MSVIIVLFILFTILGIIYKRATKDMYEDYEFMLSEREPRDNKQKLSDKVATSMNNNQFVQNMVDISMLNHNDEVDKKG